MFLEVLAAATIIGLVAGGKLSNLGNLNIKYIYLIAASFLIQAGIEFLDPRYACGGYPYLHVFSYFILFFTLGQNRQMPGIYVILAGTALNFVVIALNGGRMPVRPDVLPQQLAAVMAAGRGGTHQLITESTRFQFLADKMYVVLPYQHQLISIGDIFINVGLLILVIWGMREGYDGAC